MSVPYRSDIATVLQITHLSRRYGISSFVYRARRPFNPKRLYKLIHDKFVLMEGQIQDDEEGDDKDDEEEEEEEEEEENEGSDDENPSQEGSDEWEDESESDVEMEDEDEENDFSKAMDPKVSQQQPLRNSPYAN